MIIRKLEALFSFRFDPAQFNKATSEISVRPQPKTERVKPKKRLGKQETKPVSGEIKKRSFFSSLTGWDK
jgi:hypothetical protein